MWRSLLAGMVGLTLPLLLAAPCMAEPTRAELVAARDMFGEARDEEKAGNWTKALTLFEAVAKVKLTPQVRFHIALCEEQTGKLLEALNDFERARTLALSIAYQIQ